MKIDDLLPKKEKKIDPIKILKVRTEDTYLSDIELQELIQLEQTIEVHTSNVLSSAKEIGQALATIRDKKLFKKRRKDLDIPGFPEFADYVKFRFKKGKVMGYHYMNLYSICKSLEEANVDSDELGTINNGLILHKEVKDFIKNENVDSSDIEDYTKRITYLGWKAVIDTCPRDENGKPIITPESVHNTFQTMKEVLRTKTVEIDGEQIPISISSLGFQDQATLELTERIKRRKQELFDQSEEARQRRFREKPIPKMKIVSNEKQPFIITCPKHGETKIKSLISAGFKTVCGCYAVIELINTQSSQFVRTD